MGDDFSRLEPEPRIPKQTSLESQTDFDQQARDATSESMLENGLILPEDL
jgi:hypothetical protein